MSNMSYMMFRFKIIQKFHPDENHTICIVVDRKRNNGDTIYILFWVIFFFKFAFELFLSSGILVFCCLVFEILIFSVKNAY